MKKILSLRIRRAGKMFNAINEMLQNPKRIMLVSQERKKELEKLYPYLKGRFKTNKELNKISI